MKDNLLSSTFETFQFCGLLSVVFILELSAGITGYILKGSTYQLISGQLKPTMIDYQNTNKSHIAIGWDNIQETFKCCGLDSSVDHPGFMDWQAEIGGIPLSCCDIPHGQVDHFTCDKDQTTMHASGCVQAFGDFIKSHALSLALAGVVLAVIQLIGLLSACLIARQIKKNRGF